MATATRGTTKKKNTRSPSLNAVLLARKKTVHCQSVTLDSKTLHPERVTVRYCAWFTSASVLFNLLVCPRADVRRASYVSWGQHTSPGSPLPPTRQHPANRHYGTWLVRLLLSNTTQSLPALGAATQSEGVWCVLRFVRHFSTEEKLPRVALFFGQSICTRAWLQNGLPQRLFHVTETHSSSLRRVIKLSSTGMVRIWYTPKRYLKIFHSQNGKWAYKVKILALFPIW